MDIKIIKDTDNYMEILLKNVDLALVNSLKRICGEEVKTLAIDTVDFYDYNGIIPLEMLAHRLGLVPIYSVGEETIFELNVTADHDGQVVYSKELIADDTKVVYDDMPLVNLNKNQTIKLKAKATWNNGAEHYKWSPVCPATFKDADGSITADKTKDFGDYIFTINSTGSLTPKEIFTDALNILHSNLDKFIMKIH